MIMKKVDEMERFQNEKSAVYAFVFYDLALSGHCSIFQ